MSVVRFVVIIRPEIRAWMETVLGYDPYPDGKLIVKEWR